MHWTGAGMGWKRSCGVKRGFKKVMMGLVCNEPAPVGERVQLVFSVFVRLETKEQRNRGEN